MSTVNKDRHEPRKAYLIPYSNKSFAKPLLIGNQRTYIGRSQVDGLHIQLDDKHLSRRHACILSEDRQFLIEDLGSQNGTYLNNKRIKKALLRNHDRISIGSRTYLFLLQPDKGCEFLSESVCVASDTIDVSLQEIDFADVWAQNADQAARGFLDQTSDEASEAPPLDTLAHTRLSLLYQLSEDLRSISDAKDIYEKGIALIMKAMPSAEYALVARRSASDDAFNILAFKLGEQRRSDNDTIPISHTVFDWVLTEKVALVSENLSEDQRFQESESISINDLRSIVCAPINGKNGVMGLLYAQANNLLSPFTKDDAKFVSAVANELALNIDNIHLQKEMLRNERMAAIGLTVSHLAHNIRNLLSANQSAAQLIDNYIKEKDYRRIEEKWQWLKSSLDGISRLSCEMLAYAREDELHVKPVDINALILANRSLFEAAPSSGSLKVEVTLTDKDTVWPIDEVQLQQALLNLILNAADALQGQEDGRILISTSVTPAGHLMISVKDNGCGIPYDQQRKVLDLFFTTKGNKGTGLGLPMVQKFVDRSGGQLAFQSDEGKGSVFIMTFPKIDRPFSCIPISPNSPMDKSLAV